LLVPKVDYFQVVFTLPDKLSSLALGNRREIYSLLFRSAWAALRGVIEKEQGFEAAAAMVLHTWNQKLEPHAHVHALVPGGGPSLEGARRWIKSRCRSGQRHDGPYLVEAKDLRKQFRKKFLNGLKRLHRKGELKLVGEWSHLQDEHEFDKWLEPMKNVDWVTYIEPPPGEDAKPEHVVKYLARYMTGGPISDRRLIAHEDGDVTFWARTGKKPKPGQRAESKPYTLPGTKFAQRWSLHILPKGYVKSRRFGGYSNHHRQRYMEECRELAGISAEESTLVEEASESEAIDPVAERSHACPQCGETMECIAGEDRPGWSRVMNGPSRPWWYEDG
jgi:hypothetical protein